MGVAMKEAMKLALEALEFVNQTGDTQTFDMCYADKAITAIKEALAQPEQEPVAYGMGDTMIGRGNRMMYVRLDKGQDGCTIPLYTTPPQLEERNFCPRCGKRTADLTVIHTCTPPPQRTWVGLTEEDRRTVHNETFPHRSVMWYGADSYARAIEAKLKEKNT